MGASNADAAKDEEDALERALRDAQVMAAKMTGDDEGGVSDHSKSTFRQDLNISRDISLFNDDDMEPILDQAEEMMRNIKRQGSSQMSSNNSLGSSVNASALAPLEDPFPREDKAQEDIDEVLRKSEALLTKMRSSSSMGKSMEDSASTMDAINSQETPSSVYVLRTNNNSVADDVSSVGSSSLRNSRKSMTGADPSTKKMVQALQNSRSMADTLQKFQNKPEKNPATPVPSNPDETVKVADFTDTQAKMATVIPDFSTPEPNAKWETIQSAEESDDDYVPLVDYSAKKPRPIPMDESTRRSMRTEHSVSRLHTFRVKARRRRRKQRRVLAGLALLLMAGMAYLYYHHEQECQQYLQQLTSFLSILEEESAAAVGDENLTHSAPLNEEEDSNEIPEMENEEEDDAEEEELSTEQKEDPENCDIVNKLLFMNDQAQSNACQFGDYFSEEEAEEYYESIENEDVADAGDAGDADAESYALEVIDANAGDSIPQSMLTIYDRNIESASQLTVIEREILSRGDFNPRKCRNPFNRFFRKKFRQPCKTLAKERKQRRRSQAATLMVGR